MVAGGSGPARPARMRARRSAVFASVPPTFRPVRPLRHRKHAHKRTMTCPAELQLLKRYFQASPACLAAWSGAATTVRAAATAPPTHASRAGPPPPAMPHTRRRAPLPLVVAASAIVKTPTQHLTAAAALHTGRRSG